MALLHLHRRHAPVERTLVTRRVSAPSPLQMLVALIGAALVALGIAVLVRGGVSGAFDEHSTRIFGIDHTPRVGTVEIIAGVLLMLTSLRAATAVIASLIGTAMVAAGVMVLVGSDSLQRDIGMNDAGGWVAIVTGAVIVIACSTPRSYALRRSAVNAADVA
jgi:hypothetical protein